MTLSLKQRPGLAAIPKAPDTPLPTVTPKPANLGRKKCQPADARGRGQTGVAHRLLSEFAQPTCIHGVRAWEPQRPQAAGWEESRAIPGEGGDGGGGPEWSEVPLGLDSLCLFPPGSQWAEDGSLRLDLSPTVLPADENLPAI